MNNTSVRRYWKILFYPPNTDTGTFYGGSTDIDIDVQYPKFNTDILVFPVFSSTIFEVTSIIYKQGFLIHVTVAENPQNR